MLSIMNENLSAKRSAKFRALPRRKLAAQVTDQLRRAIVGGTFSQNETLAEEKIARQFGVSRAPIREAFAILEQELLIESLDNGRRRVRSYSKEDFYELLDIRISLECRACFLLATRLSRTMARRLEKLIDQQEASSDVFGLSRLDVEFHAVIVEQAGNQWLSSLWLRIRPQFEAWLTQMQARHHADAHVTLRETIRSHRNLLAALKSGDSEAAETRMRKDLDGWFLVMEKFVFSKNCHSLENDRKSVPA